MAGNSKPCRRGGTSTVGADDGMEMVGAKGKKSTSGTDARDSSGHGYLQLKLTGQTGLARCCSSRFDNEEEKGIFRMRDPSSKVVQRWTRGFICLALVSVYLDPFFYLLPAVNLGAVCIYTQMWFALSLTAARTILDCAYFFHMLFQFRIAYVKPCSRVFGRGELVTDRWAVAIHYLKGSFIIDLLAVLPVPQIVLWFVIPRVVGNPANKLKNILRIMVLFQYIPRLYCIVHLAGKLRSSSGAVFEHAWAGIGVNLLVLLLVSHIAGAAWYMLSVERVDTCWRQHCKPPECNVKNLDCLQQAKDAYAELKVARDSCQPGSEDLSFNFGIYEEAIGTIMHGALLEKYIYSLWWGVRNVSSVGSNLVTSAYIGEILFCITISVIGLIIFTLLVANMQTYWTSLTTRVEEMRTSRRDTEYWMWHRRLPKDLRERVRRYEAFKWAATRGVNEELLLEKLPWDLRRDIKRHLAIDLIRKVPLFEKMDSNLQDAICLCLQPAMFVEGTVMIREDDPVQSMLFIIKGRMESSTTNGGRTGFLNTRQLRAGDFCGEELLTWALEPKSQHDSLPKSSRRVLILDEVEAFSLGADDLKYVASQFRRLHSKEIQHTLRCYSQQWQTWAACAIQAAWRRKKIRERKHREARREAKRAAGKLLDPEDDSDVIALPLNVARVARGLTLTSSSSTVMYDTDPAGQSRGNVGTCASLENIDEEQPHIAGPRNVNPKGTRLRLGTVGDVVIHTQNFLREEAFENPSHSDKRKG